MTNAELVTNFLAGLSSGAAGESLAGYFHEDVVQEEMPNLMYPNGQTRDRNKMLEDSKRGAKLMRSQRFDLVSVISEGDRVAVEADWTGTIAAAMGPYPE